MKMNPTYFAALTLMITPNTPLDTMVKEGTFEPVTDPYEILDELELIIENINAPGPVVFRTNHASNYLPLKGTLPRDREKLLDIIRAARKDRNQLRPESTRAL